jgi:hypothetical protein
MTDEKLTFAAVRELGLALPRAREARYFRMPALKVDDKIFAVRTSHRSAERNSISVPVGFKRREELIAADPRVYYLKPHYEPYPVVLVRLDCIDRDALRRLLRSAYDAVSSGVVIPGRRNDLFHPISTRRPPKELNGLHWPFFA